MDQAAFTVSYNGPALDGHTMDVRDLAPALLSLSSVFTEASTLIYHDKVDVRLHVRAMEPGSFDVDLALVQTFAGQVKDLLIGDWSNAALNLVGLVVASKAAGGGLIALIKKLRGRSPARIKELENGMVRIDIDGESIEIHKDLLSLYQDINIRQAVSKAVSPLRKEGIDSIRFRNGRKVVEEITKADVDSFAPPHLPEEVVLKERRKAAFSIVSLAFKDENKWRLHDGNNTIYVTIDDEDFLRKVESNEIAFRKSDILICEVEDISTRDESGLNTEHHVIRVLEHRPAARQIPLDID